jgi:D-galactarolactone cycloisomerase
MKIKSIEVIGLACKLTPGRVYGSAVGLHSQRRASLIRLRTEDGIEGIGDARAPVGLVRAAIELMKPAFIGSNLHDRETVFNRILNTTYHLGNQGAVIAAYSGLNIAMLDAVGKGVGLPVCKLLGGMVRSEVPVYATGGHYTLNSAADLPPQMEELCALGVAGVKIKIGMGVDSDAERAAVARRIVGDDIFLAVDANANYTADVALESMRRMAPYRIAWFEEPLKPHDYAGYSYLRSRALMPLSAGEAHHMAHDFLRLLKGQCVDIAQPAVCACGGLDEARRIAELCRLYGARVVPAAWSSGVGLMAAIHFAASLPPHPHTAGVEPQPQYVEFDAEENPLLNEILTEPIRIQNGTFAVSDVPGLGIALNEDAVRHYTAP